MENYEEYEENKNNPFIDAEGKEIVRMKEAEENKEIAERENRRALKWEKATTDQLKSDKNFYEEQLKILNEEKKLPADEEDTNLEQRINEIKGFIEIIKSKIQNKSSVGGAITKTSKKKKKKQTKKNNIKKGSKKTRKNRA